MITEKSTKTAIYEAYTEALKEVENLKGQNDGLQAALDKAKKNQSSALADSVLESGIVSKETIDGIKALNERIDSLKEDVENLTGIHDMALEIDAMVITKNQIVAKCQDDIREAEAQRDEAVKSAEADKKKKLDAIKKETLEAEAEHKAEEDAYKQKTEKRRKEDEEDWQDEFARKKKKDLADLEDDFEAQKKSFNEWVESVDSRERKCDAIESENSELKGKILELEQYAKDQYEQGKTDGKKSADKSHAFETRALEQKIAHLGEQKDFEVTTLKDQLVEAKEKITSLQMLLDKAYTEQKDLAKSVAEASRPVVVQNQTTGK